MFLGFGYIKIGVSIKRVRVKATPWGECDFIETGARKKKLNRKTERESHSYLESRTALPLKPPAAQAAAQTVTMYTHSTPNPKGMLACIVGSVRLTAPVSTLARRNTPSKWRFNACKRSGAGRGQTRLVARQMHSTKSVCSSGSSGSGSSSGSSSGSRW